MIAGLCVFTSLPWVTGQIMPDLFSPVLLLGTFLLAFCGDQLRRGTSLRRRTDYGWCRDTFQSCADRVRFDSVVYWLEAHLCAKADSPLAMGGAPLDPIHCGGLFHAGGDVGRFSRNRLCAEQQRLSSSEIDRRGSRPDLLDASLPERRL